MLTTITDYAARMLIPLQLVGDERVTPYLRQVLAPQLQQIENTIALLKTRLDLDKATGDLLDKLGSIVGQARLFGDVDAIYRRKIRTRMAVNRSKGTKADLALVARLACMDKFVGVTFWPSLPMGFGVAISLTELLTDDEKAVVDEFMTEARAAAYSMNLAQYTDPVFALLEDPDPAGAGLDVGALADFFHSDP